MKNFRVTALIAHHNYQEYLAGALKSVKTQTHPCHACVIDDCSEDGKSVRKILDGNFELIESTNEEKESRSKHPTRFYNGATLIYLFENRKQAYARNCGIEQLWDQTDIFIVLDADDEMYPNKVEECVKVIEQAPSEIGLVYADHETLNTTTGRLVREYREPYSLHRLQQECIVHSGSAINKIALEATKEETGYFDINLPPVEDYDLWLRIAEKFMVVHIPKSLSLIRVQPNNCTNTIAQEFWRQQHQKLAQKFQIRNNPNAK